MHLLKHLSVTESTMWLQEQAHYKPSVAAEYKSPTSLPSSTLVKPSPPRCCKKQAAEPLYTTILVVTIIVTVHHNHHLFQAAGDVTPKCVGEPEHQSLKHRSSYATMLRLTNIHLPVRVSYSIYVQDLHFESFLWKNEKFSFLKRYVTAIVTSPKTFHLRFIRFIRCKLMHDVSVTQRCSVPLRYARHATLTSSMRSCHVWRWRSTVTQRI